MAEKQLHEMIAVKKGVKSRRIAELTTLYQEASKGDLFAGVIKTYKPLDENDPERLSDERKLVQRNARDMLKRAGEAMTELYDVEATIDVTNANARADIVVDDEVIARDVPATTLIFLEKQLEDWATFIKSFVVPDEAVEWIEGEDSLRTREALSYRTAKKLQTIKKAAATEKHPEQVDVVTVDAIVGTYTTVKLSGAMPARQKREHAERAAKLLDAVRAARERAATTPIVRKEIGRSIFQFLLK